MITLSTIDFVQTQDIHTHIGFRVKGTLGIVVNLLTAKHTYLLREEAAVSIYSSLLVIFLD